MIKQENMAKKVQSVTGPFMPGDRIITYRLAAKYDSCLPK
jgi:hypothetical protein